MTVRRLIVVGAGGFGREMYWLAETHPDRGTHWRLGGFLDDSPAALAGREYPHGIIGSIRAHQPEEDDLFVVGLGQPRARRVCCEALSGRGARFLTFIHPTAIVGRNTRLGQGVVLLPRVMISCDVQVGEFTVFTPSNAGHDATVGDYCQISTGCDIMADARLGNDVFLGSGARVMPGYKVGDGAFVGAGSVVMRDLDPGEKVFGMPARALPRT